MPQFLKQIAEHYYNTQNISDLCFIFPNRRSMVFFRKWLSETAKNDPQSRVFTMPELLTMNDFFYKVSGSAVTDRVSLLLELYDCYKALNPKAEWGEGVRTILHHVAADFLSMPRAYVFALTSPCKPPNNSGTRPQLHLSCAFSQLQSELHDRS